jgi:ABC-2 type transport system permease protein
MKKIWIIIEREYLSRVKKKSFIITTFLAPVGFALLFIAAILLSGYGESKKRIAVIDESGYFKGRIADSKTLYFSFVDTPLRVLELHFRQMNFDGVLHIPVLQNLTNVRGIEFRSDKNLGIKSLQYIEHEIGRVVKDIKLEKSNIDRELVRQLSDVNVKIKTVIYGEEGGKTGSTLIATALGYIMGLTIYMVMFIYGTQVMRSVMEEKSNRILEIMASSVKPFQLMMGKIIGVGMVSITQFILWAILIFITNLILTAVFSANLAEIQQLAMSQSVNGQEQAPDQYEIALALASLKDINFLQIGFLFLLYFLGGYLLYGALFAAIGAASGEEQDSQSLTFIVSLPIIISIFIMMTAIQEPENELAFWGSVIPFTSPVVMPALVPFGVPWWQIIASLLMLVAGFVFTTWLAAKIYRVGILMYGKKITIKELIRWLSY